MGTRTRADLEPSKQLARVLDWGQRESHHRRDPLVTKTGIYILAYRQCLSLESIDNSVGVHTNNPRRLFTCAVSWAPRPGPRKLSSTQTYCRAVSKGVDACTASHDLQHGFAKICRCAVWVNEPPRYSPRLLFMNSSCM